ncbi:hypothetical protein UVI_02054100 [Ustilaginoidea virens]|uniref:Uncharacterized protein n=1 Tax=Ustilaginoidea virens TaxID=1159556 RepID=A0A1B5L0Z0_USTVR|nr:hypothetical protein UVI_02054100 [Ustilaginoidea virens]
MEGKTLTRLNRLNETQWQASIPVYQQEEVGGTRTKHLVNWSGGYCLFVRLQPCPATMILARPANHWTVIFLIDQFGGDPL